MSNKLKYESAYYETIEDTLPVEELIEEYNENIIHFSSKYKDKLYCPECKKVKLTMKKSKSVFLAGFPNDEHGDGCSKIVDIASSKQVKEYVDKVTNKQKINRQLDALLNKMLLHKNEKMKKNKLHSSYDKENYDSTFEVKEENQVKRKTIPRKRLESLDSKKEADQNYVMYYGEVFLEIDKVENIVVKDNTTGEEKYNFDTQKIRIKKINPKTGNKILLCRIEINGYKIEKLKDVLSVVDDDKTYKVALLGKVTKKEIYNNFKLEHPEYFILK